MNPLKSLLAFDQKIVDILESFCHWQQRWLGVTHYVWLKFFAITHASAIYVFILPDNIPSERVKGWILIISLLACIPVFGWWERKSLARILKGFANPLRKSERAIFVRFIVGYYSTTHLVVGMTVATLIDPQTYWVSLLIMIWWVTLASLYVLPACDPLPPTAGRWRELIVEVFLKRARS